MACNNGNSGNLALQVEKFAKAGGRIAWIAVCVYSPKTQDLNDILAARFGVMIDYKLGSRRTKFEGRDFCPLWDGLFIGLPSAANTNRRDCLAIGKDRGAIALAEVDYYGGKKITTSAIVRPGEQGEGAFCLRTFLSLCRRPG